ncbi:MAG: dTDP-4-dehydrorhamnose reductase [Alphaproteobacteria bacterium]|nr:dTDP-4-dehydrorhamnose reductase [Alphaproteobacteria bacterium]
MLLITGCNGQLGTELRTLLPQALAVDVTGLDITDRAAVRTFVKENDIDTIINCAAYTAVDKAEDEPEKCRKINVDGVKNLALTGVKIVHISTDYVFDGTGSRPYVETDQANPVSVYGQSKLDAEKAVLENAETALIVRTAWLYSPYGANFVKTMRRLGAEKEEISVVFDQIGTPTYAADLAKAIVDLLPQMKDGAKEIYHYSNEGVCSWYDFSREIMKLSGLECRVNPIETAQYPTKAKRPFYSVLNKSKIKSLGIEISHWQESLEKCLKKF